MTLRPPSSTRTDTLFPYSTLVRSNGIGFPLWLRGFVRPKSLRPRHAEQLRLRLQPSRRARISGDAVLQRLRRFRCFAQRHAAAHQHDPAVDVGGIGLQLGFEAANHALDHRVLLTLGRSEEHTSELQSLMRISYAVFCLKKKKTNTPISLTEIVS